MSLPTLQIKRGQFDTSKTKLNGLIDGELGFNQADNGLWIGPKGCEDGSEDAILLNVTTGDQSFSGLKTFEDGIKVNDTPTETSTNSVAVLKDGRLSSITPDNLVKSFSNLAGLGLTMSGSTIKAKLNSENSLGTIGTTNKLYAVGVDSNGKLAVSVPVENILYVGSKDTASNSATKNGETHLKLYENATKRAQFKLTGDGFTSISSDANGNLTISTAMTAADIEAVLGYIPEGAALIQFTPVDVNSNVLQADYTLAQMLEAFDDGKVIRGLITVDETIIPLTPCTVQDTQIIFLATLGLQLIAVTVTANSITMSNTALVNEDHTHTLNYVPEGTITNITLTPQGTVSSSFKGVEHSHTFSTTSSNTGATASASQATIKSIVSAGTLPTATLNPGTLPTCNYVPPVLTHKDPEITTTLSQGCLTVALSAGSSSITTGSVSFNQGTLPSLEFNAGSLPTTEDVVVAKGDHKHSYNIVNAINNTVATGTVTSTFTGTPIEHTHNFNGTQANIETNKVK